MASTAPLLLDSIYSAAANPEAWPALLTDVSDHIGAIGGMIAYLDIAEAQGAVVSGRLSGEATEAFRLRHIRNPWTAAVLKVRPGDSVIIGDVTDFRAIRRSLFFDEVLAPQAIVDNINAPHAAFDSPTSVGGFGFCLSAKASADGPARLRRLRPLLPHLSRALDVTMRLAPYVGGGLQLEYVVQLLPSPALLLDERGRVSFANLPAEQLLASGGLALDRDRRLSLNEQLPGTAAALAKALAETQAVAAGRSDRVGAPVRLSRLPPDGPLLVVPVPLPPLAFEPWRIAAPARVLVLVLDPNQGTHNAAEKVQRTFGLTTTEARVAALVAGGMRGPQAAMALGVSAATVKTHLQRIFDKTGLHSQVALARLLASMPAIPPTIATSLSQMPKKPSRQ